MKDETTVGMRAVAYMSEMMDMHEATTNQEQNQLLRHLVQFAEREVRRSMGLDTDKSQEVAMLATGLGPSDDSF